MSVGESNPASEAFQRRVDNFLGTTVYTVPAGVTHLTVFCKGGGGAASSTVNGSPTTVDLTNPVTAPGGTGGPSLSERGLGNATSYTASANTGEGQTFTRTGRAAPVTASATRAGDGGIAIGGGAVTPGQEIAVTIGAGAGGGGSGFAYVEYEVSI